MNNMSNIVIINKAGKAGKSTIAKHLITPMLGAEWIQVETFNDSGSGTATKVAGRKFGFVAEAVAALGSSKCIDVGNSNYEAVKKEIQQIDGFVDEIAFWVIPCTESAGIINDSLSTVGDLINDLGVDPHRIIVIPNKVERPEEGLDRFGSVFRAAKKIGFCFCEVPVVDNPKFDVFNKDERSILEIATDDFDYAARIAAEADAHRRAELAEAKIQQGRARFLSRNLRAVWAATPLASLPETANSER